MNIQRLSQIRIVLIFLVLLGLMGCEYDAPTEIWDPDKTAGVTPVITEIIPDAIAPAGVNEIKIIGENFSSNVEEIALYVNGINVPLKSASITELSIYRPKFTGDSLTIKLVKEDAYEIVEYFPYSIEEIGSDYGDTEPNDYFYDFDLDADENIIAHDRRKMFVGIPRDGVREELFDCGRIRKIFDIKIGPDGAYYVAVDKSYILIATPEEPDGDKLGRLDDGVTKLDFDQWGNIYTGGDKTGLFVLHPDATDITYDVLTDYEFSCIRVFEDYVYISGSFEDAVDVQTGIWRLPILDSTGQLGDVELVMNWAEIGAKADTTELMDFTFAADGTMFIATDGGSSNIDDPIIMRYPDGILDYFYPGGLLEGQAGLTGPIVSLVWGNENYLYLWRGGNTEDNRRIVRLKMLQNGAPYYGRFL